MTEPLTADRRPHVVMTVGNPVQNDARVRKAALSVAAMGNRVTVLGLSPDGRAFEESFGPVRLVNVEVVGLLADSIKERQRVRRRLLMPFGYPTREVAMAALRRRNLAERELLAETGRVLAGQVSDTPARQVLRSAKGARNKALRKVTYARTRLQRLYTSQQAPLDRLGGAVSRRVRQVGPLGSWRRLMPEMHDMEIAYGPLIDSLDPDLVHAHDLYMIGIAERAVARARAKGRTVPWIYDAHEFVAGMSRYSPTRIAAMADLELEYIGRADRVITVSEPIADAIQKRCHLAVRPTVVLNVPALTRPRSAQPPSVRAVTGLSDDVPLLVYSGNIDPDRGVTTLVEALAHLDGVHAVIVTNAPEDNRYVTTLRGVAAAGGAGDRLHLAPYVEGDDIIDYLGSASVGVHGLSHVPNHEMALPNKLFDYLHAGLPMVVSNVKAMSELVTALGIGEVYTAGDPSSLADAVRRVLADRERYASASRSPELLRQYSWEAQEEALRGVYSDLLSGVRE